jgi:hypothetical protein
MMVTLIPILLLSTAFLQIKIIETPLPQVVAKAIADNKNDLNPRAELSIESGITSGFNITVVASNGARERISVPNVDGKFNYSGLHQRLYLVKSKYPDIFKLSLSPESSVPYDEIIKTMDAARKTEAGEAKFIITNKDSGESAETDLMFPEVVFGNVIEG